MSYYDHATMMAYRLGPWCVDPPGAPDETEPFTDGPAPLPREGALARLRSTFAEKTANRAQSPNNGRSSSR